MKRKMEPVGTDYTFEFHTPDMRYKRLLLFVPNFDTTSDEDGVIDQSYLLLATQINHCGTLACQFQERMTKKPYTSNRVY